VLASGNIDPGDAQGLVAATDDLVEQRLSTISRTAPAFSAVLRAYRRALLADEAALAEGLIAWLGGQPTVAAAVKRAAGVKGDLDPFGAMHFLGGLLTILRDSGRPGLVLVSRLANIDYDLGYRVICGRDYWDGATNQAIKG
jgi:hypothetical protein